MNGLIKILPKDFLMMLLRMRVWIIRKMKGFEIFTAFFYLEDNLIFHSQRKKEN